MFYGYENPVEMPISELFDTGLMNAYTQAVKAEYEKGEKRLDDFISKYGDFRSPFAKDIKLWDALTMGRINNVYNQLVSQGIDPLRTREGQMALAKAVRETPVGLLNQLKQSADAGEQYLKSKGDLQSKGLYSKEMEDYFMKIPFEQWNTAEYGLFDRTSPIQYKDIHDITDDWFKHSEKKFDEKLTKQKGDGYDYYTVTEDDINGIIDSNVKDFLDSDYGKYYYQKARNIVQSMNPTAPKDKIDTMAMQKFREDIVNRNSDYLRNERRVNEYAKLNYEDKLERRRKQWEWANDPKYQKDKDPIDAQNYHQNVLLNGLYNLSGKTDFLNSNVSSDTKITVAKNAVKNVKKTVQGFWKYAPGERVNKIVNYTTLKGSEETPSFIGEKFSHDKGKTYGNWVINNKKVEGLTLSQNELNRLMDRTNWAANTANSKIAHSKFLHNKIGRTTREKIEYTEKKNGKNVTKNKSKYRWIFVPYNTGNVATTVNNDGKVIQANRGTLHAVNVDDNSKQLNFGEVYLPFNTTDAVTTDGKARQNEIITAQGSRTRVDQQENRVRKVMGIRNTDKGANTGYYDY